MINHEVHAVLGPQRAVEASFVAELATKAQVPVVSASVTSPLLLPSETPYFLRAAPIDSAQVGALAALVQAFGWRRVVPVYEESEYGTPLVPFLIDALDAVGVQVPYRCALPDHASDDRISAELYNLKTQQTRVFLVHMASTLALRLFKCAENAGMMAEGYVWIATEGFTSLLPSFEPAVVLDTMQGVLGVRSSVPRSEALHDFRRRWRREFWKENPNYNGTDAEINNFGLWAYDAAWAVAMAAESVGPVGPEFVASGNGSTDLSKLGVSQTGPKLLEAISQTEFDGLAGRFRLANGELNVSAYEIVNVIGEKGKRIGFWTARYGLTRQFNRSSENPYSATRDGLGPVIWPGDSTEVPKGWETPTSGRKLRILVPGAVEPGFRSFLNVEKDPVSNETKASGYVIEVFEAAVGQLPYALPFEYVPYQNAEGKNATEYNDLVQEVFLQVG